MGNAPQRACPVCASHQYTEFATEQIIPEKLTEYSYASRKEPEFMRLYLVQCASCQLVYAPTPPAHDELTTAYSAAAYDSAEEADFAAKTYASVLKPSLSRLPHLHCAVDIGAGNGALLPLLQQLGFHNAVGIEPSHAAVITAPPERRPYLREAMFSPEIIADLSPSLITSCMTLEHVDSPMHLLQAAYASLNPGGMVAVVVHNRKAWLNRVLGLKSPIIDIEHLQLFCPHSLTTLMENSGFSQIHIAPFANTYPLRYWLRLLPLPGVLKTALQNTCQRMGISALPCTIPVGNMLGLGIKKHS